MKKALLIVLGLAGLLALLPTAQAITYPFEGGMAGLTADPVYTTGPYQRYYTPGDDDVNRNCTVTCGTGGASCDQTDPAMKYCKLTYNSTKKAFRGYGENVANYNAALEDGTVFYSILDAQKVDGGRTVGLYAWVAGPVWNNSKNTWSAADCVGTTVAQACIGNANPSNARAVTGNPPGGALNVVGGLSPIPAPLAFDIDHDGNAYTVGGVKGTFQLQWDAAFAVGPAATGLVPVGYDLYFAKSAPSGGSCASPTPAQYTFLETIPGVQAQIPYTAVGMADPNEAACVTFALKVVFPSTLDGKKMVTRYLSSNGTTFALGGLAANVYDLAANIVGKTNVEVSWKTSLEDGVRGFYVTRALTQNGTYTRVSDLIPANGEPSAYSFIDNITKPSVPVKATGLYYKVESVDIDDAVTPYGPVKVQLPTERTTVIKDRTKKAPRK